MPHRTRPHHPELDIVNYYLDASRLICRTSSSDRCRWCGAPGGLAGQLVFYSATPARCASRSVARALTRRLRPLGADGRGRLVTALIAAAKGQR
jgi:hypothetical protein